MTLVTTRSIDKRSHSYRILKPRRISGPCNDLIKACDQSARSFNRRRRATAREFRAISNLARALAALAAALFLTRIAKAEPLAYVANQGSNSVSVVDIANNSTIATIAVGVQPVRVAASTVNPLLYVTNFRSDTVSVIDTATEAVTATIPTLANPLDVALTPDGARVYVSHPNDGALSIIDTRSNTVYGTIPVGITPTAIAISPAGGFAYVADFRLHSVYRLNIATDTIDKTIEVGRDPTSIAISSDGARAYIGVGLVLGNFGSGSIVVVDTETSEVLSGPVLPPNTLPVSVVIAPSGAFAAVATTGLSELGGVSGVFTIAMDTTSLRELTTLQSAPTAIAISESGEFAYLTSANTNNVYVVEIATGATAATIPVGDSPSDIAVVRSTPLTCVGDHNNDRWVTIDELVTMASIVLGNSPLRDCLAGDADHNEEITVDELMSAVGAALTGCFASTDIPS